MAMQVFLSAASADLKACRDTLASDLRAVGCQVSVQEDFQQGPGSLLERLEEFIARCDRVIALVGGAYGSEAPGSPNGIDQRSYTQWEYHFALGERLSGVTAARKDLYVYVASASYLALHPIEQSPATAELQRAFVAAVQASGKHWVEFDTVDGLCRRVLRDAWQVQERPHRPSNLPYASLGKWFKGRDRVLEELDARLAGSPGHATAIVSTQAIYGLGGVGKTRLAIEYALRNHGRYTALLFVEAEHGKALRSNLAALCAGAVLNLPEQHVNEESARVVAALRWLAEHPGWLLIFDNVDSPEAATAVDDVRAQLRGGDVLVTSRMSAWSAGVHPFEIDILDLESATAFLLARTQDARLVKWSDEADARELADLLGGLALALEQAGAFIGTRHISFSDYLRRWREGESRLRSWFDARLTKYPRSMAVTWDTTVNQLSQDAYSLLRLLAWFAPEPIAPAVLSPAERLLIGSDDPPQEEPVIADVESALAELGGYSLLKWETDKTTFRVHRLVQEVTRQRISGHGQPREREFWVLAALSMVAAAVPPELTPHNVESWPVWALVRPHVATLTAWDEAQGVPGWSAGLLVGLAIYLNGRALFDEAEQPTRRALSITEKSQGKDHPSVVQMLGTLVVVLANTNRLPEAEPLARRALGILEASYGEDDPRVAAGLNSLADVLQASDRHAEAEPLARRALSIIEESCSKDDPTVTIHLNFLAGILRATNRLAEAESLIRRALVIEERGYGKNHLRVAVNMHNLACVLQDAHRVAEAEPLMRRALEVFEESLGKEHPDSQHARRRLQLLCTTLSVQEPLRI